MYADISQPAPPVPQPQLQELQQGMNLIPPLSRRGRGPGMILLVPDSTSQLIITEGVPWPSLKWAEEGYAVVEIQASAVVVDPPSTILGQALKAFEGCAEFESPERVGIIAYTPDLWNLVAPSLPLFESIACAIIHGETNTEDDLLGASIPVLRHLAGVARRFTPRSIDGITRYHYSTAKSHKFALPFQNHFHYGTESLAHTRSLTFLKPLMRGPYFDLEEIWGEHTHYEFNDRSMEHTMSTMVQEPYVNHVPTLTGGIGRNNLSKFYRDNFIFNNSADTELELISRTVGIDRIIDEFIFKFTHDQCIDWLLPGVPPTGRQAEVPFTAAVNIRGDRLYHEHIAWDQGTLLKQLGLLPEYLPYPYPIADDGSAGHDKKYEYRVPVLGLDTANKMRDKNSVASNEMFGYKIREVDK